MSAAGPKSVGDLWKLVGDGETRLFAHTQERTGDEPIYYWVTTAGEYPATPRWDNPLPIETRPRPAMRDLAPIPLGETQFRFSIDADRDQLADLYYVTPGVLLVSSLILRLLDAHGVAPAERRVARLDLRGGASTQDFQVIIPPVLDIVDVDKTNVLIARKEVFPGGIVVELSFPNGRVFRESAPPAFLGKYDVDWWWRENLVRAAVEAGVRGLRAVHMYNADYTTEIRTK